MYRARSPPICSTSFGARSRELSIDARFRLDHALEHLAATSGWMSDWPGSTARKDRTDEQYGLGRIVPPPRLPPAICLRYASNRPVARSIVGQQRSLPPINASDPLAISLDRVPRSGEAVVSTPSDVDFPFSCWWRFGLATRAR